MHDSKKIPAFVEMVAQIASDVTITAVIGGLKITGPSVEAERQKRATQNATAFAADQNARHHACRLRKSRYKPGADR